MRKIGIIVGLLFLVLLPLMAAERDTLECPVRQDSSLIKTLFNSSMFKGNTQDSLIRARHERTFFHRLGKTFTTFFREFSNIDERYIEPQHFNYTVMLQNTNTYEEYTLYGKEGQRISFAPDPSWRLGPYLGWRWVFLGYTLDLKHINTKDNHSSKKEFNLSLYSSLLGVDLFWRQTGNDYHIQRMNLGDHINTDALRKVSFDGFKSSIKGLNLYYIFNHRKFSYPAAYSQSTRQKKSAGSWMVGLGYTQHQLEVDWDKLSAIVDESAQSETKQQLEAKIDSSLMFSNTVVNTIGSVMLDPTGGNHPGVIRNITDVIVVQSDGTQTALGLGGYLDIGLLDTMEDLFVNFIGALTFSIIGYFYVRSRGKNKFAKRFIPVVNEEPQPQTKNTSAEDAPETEKTKE